MPNTVQCSRTNRLIFENFPEIQHCSLIIEMIKDILTLDES